MTGPPLPDPPLPSPPLPGPPLPGPPLSDPPFPDPPFQDPAVRPAEVLDCRGQRCPLPVIALARRLPELPIGGVLRVVADDPAAAVDIPAWCRLRHQEYVGVSTEDGLPAHDVRRAS